VKDFGEKLNLPPTHPLVTARIVEHIRSMTPEEALAFLSYRTPGIKEYWLGKPIRKPRRRSTTASKNGAGAKA
jgi:hypothetical protein